MKMTDILLVSTKDEASKYPHKYIFDFLKSFGMKVIFIEDKNINLDELNSDLIFNLGNHDFFFMKGEYSKFLGLLKRSKIFFNASFDSCFPPATQIRTTLRENKIQSVSVTNFHPHLERFQKSKAWNWVNYWYYLNWNLLSLSSPLPFNLSSERCLFYYGSFRKDRVKDFSAYLKKNDYYKTVISCSDNQQMKFKDAKIYPDHFESPLKSKEDLNKYALSLYIEDEHTHNEFHSLSNRFFECLSAGTAILVDHKCLNTFKKSEVPEEEIHYVSEDNLPHIAHCIQMSDNIQGLQNRFWFTRFSKEKDKLRDQLLSILRSYL